MDDLGRLMPPMKLMLLSLGRSGGSVRFGYELFMAAGRSQAIDASIVVSRSSENAGDYLRHGAAALAVPTFARSGPIALVRHFLAARRLILDRIAADRPDAVVTVMPHVWTPLLARDIRRLAIPYVTIIHDATAHPGDPTAIVTRWLRSEARDADLVVTLSRSVAARLSQLERVPPARLLALFHPDMDYDGVRFPRQRIEGAPLRLLFFGRIHGYKGLSLLIEAIEQLRRSGLAISLGIAGAGNIEKHRARLERLDAEIVNRWLTEQEVAPLFARFDALVLPYVEASQSGVAAVAFAHAMPVVATPVAGLVEQVEDGRTGVLAGGTTVPALAQAISRLACEEGLYDRIVRHLAATASSRSMDTFLCLLVEAVGQDVNGPRPP